MRLLSHLSTIASITLVAHLSVHASAQNPLHHLHEHEGVPADVTADLSAHHTPEDSSLQLDSIPPITTAVADSSRVVDLGQDRLVIEEPKGHNELRITRATNGRNPTKAVLYSLIPGGGQIYNRQYWKLPIIVGAYTACYYAISWNNNNLMEYANAYRDIKSDRPLEHTSWQNFIPYNADPESYVNNSSFHETLRRGRDYYRRYRDLSIIISAGVYILVMIDAYVDAQLSNFDISPNLTLTYSPTYIPSAPGRSLTESGIGMSLALSF